MLMRATGVRIVRGILIAALMLAFAGSAHAYFAPNNGQPATRVLGQLNFTDDGALTSSSRLRHPGAVAVDPTSHKVFVVDTNNSRVLRFASAYGLANGAPAEAVLGQAGFTTLTATTTRNGMGFPTGAFVDAGGRLWVSDTNNNRVLRFDHASTTASGANADAVLGQSLFTTKAMAITRNGMNTPAGVFVDAGGHLWVADDTNSRVLRFNNAALKANGANADGVLGQTLFTTNTAATTQGGMALPGGVFVDAGGHLWVSDTGNSRVLRFNTAATKLNGAKADGVLGQLTFTTQAVATTQRGMRNPIGATGDLTGRLYVADERNNRILIFNAAAGLANGANASYELGQPNFTTGTADTGGQSAATFNDVSAAFYDTTARILWGADWGNNRVLMFGRPGIYFSARSADVFDGWVLELSELSSLGGTASAAGTLRVGDDASNKQYRSLLYFNTAGLPDNAKIRSVTLRIKKAGVVGADPLATFGYLLADIKKGTFGAAGLEKTDFQALASANAVGHFTSIGGGWYQLVLPAADYTYINLTGATQFRLRFTLDDNNNHIANYDTFFAGGATTSTDRPVLYLEYTVP
jgi:sugar lactone lactonase YvrE